MIREIDVVLYLSIFLFFIVIIFLKSICKIRIIKMIDHITLGGTTCSRDRISK